jgi:predicted amidohydrolase YtcJ
MIVRSLFACLLFAILSGCSTQEPADLIITGGKIYTMDDVQPNVEAVAVKNDQIIYAGTSEGVEKFKGDQTRIVDLKGQVMTPGFIEGHGHIMSIGYNEMELDLMETKSYDELVDRVREAVAKAQPGQWIVGRGWHQDKWDVKPEKMIKGFPLHQQLSEVSPDNPVFLSHASGHAGFANAKAMTIAGVNVLSKESLVKLPAGGEIIRDEAGNPTGLFNENAMALIEKHIPKHTPETDRRALELAFEACLRNGITSFHDAGAAATTIDLFHDFQKEGKLRVRLYAMVDGEDHALVQRWLLRGPEIDSSHWLTLRSIKLHCDGALGSRGAWLLEPYEDRKDFYGMATYSMDSVLSIAREALKSGFQVCSHAIGDRTNREILDRYEQAFQENPDASKDHRFRIEHAQHLHPNDITRFGKLGVLPSMQAIHMSSDRPWAIDRLGEKRIKEGAYMWQSLLTSGARIVNGTDAPVEPVNPMACFYASVTRKTLKGEPAGGYEPEEKMSREQALRSYTLDAAFGAFEENIKGSIEVGKHADFTIFSTDLMTVPEQEILKAEVVMTILGGKTVYEKPVNKN